MSTSEHEFATSQQELPTSQKGWLHVNRTLVHLSLKQDLVTSEQDAATFEQGSVALEKDLGWLAYISVVFPYHCIRSLTASKQDLAIFHQPLATSAEHSGISRQCEQHLSCLVNVSTGLRYTFL